jgi:VanZ family protein
MTRLHEFERVDPMTAALAAKLRPVSTVVLVGYWLVMFTGTHWPNLSLAQYPENTDKVLHFSGYAGFSFLLAVRLWLKQVSAGGEPPRWSGLSLRDVLLILAIVVVYSSVDEVSQTPFGRTCDYRDAIADCIGGVIGLGVFTVFRIALRRFSIA